MIRLISTFVLFCAIFPAHEVLASVDRPAMFANFRLSASCDKPAGSIVVDGSQDKSGLTSLSISAFGKNVVLNAAELSKLKSIATNEIQISCFVPYKPGIGRVYVKFTRSTPGGRFAMKFITLHEDGSVEID